MIKKCFQKVVSWLLLLIMCISPVIQTSNYAETGTIIDGNKGGTLRWGVYSEAINLNPLLRSDTASLEATKLMFRSLVKRSSDTAIVPDLAASLPEVSADGKSYKITLRDNLKWQDGVPLTAEDVKYSFEFVKNTANKSPLVGSTTNVQSVEVLSSTSFIIICSEVQSEFISTLAEVNIIPKHIWNPIDSSSIWTSAYNKSTPIGCGPYLLKEFIAKQQMVFEKNPNYSGPAFNFDRVIFDISPTAELSYQKLESGEVDAVYAPESEYYRFKNNDSLNVYQYKRNAFDTLLYNMNSPIFKDQLVRQAIASVIDRQRIIDEAYKGLGEAGYSSFDSSLSFYNPDAQKWPYDLEKAKNLLDQAGWKMGPGGIREKDGIPFKFELLTNKNNLMREKSALIISAQLLSLGIQAEPVFIDWNVFLPEYIDKGKFDVYIGGFSVGLTGDQSTFYHSNRTIGSMNKGNYANGEVDRLLVAATQTIDRAKREELYKQIQAIVAMDQPVTPLVYRKNILATNKNIENVTVYPLMGISDFSSWAKIGGATNENPINLTLEGGLNRVETTGLPNFKGRSNAVSGSPVSLVINNKTYTSAIAVDGTWEITIPAIDKLAAGTYVASCTVTESATAKKTVYQNVTIDPNMLIQGIVYKPSGEIQQGSCQAEVRNMAGRWVKSATVGRDGKFYIKGLAAGSYTITIAPYNTTAVTASKSVVITTDGVTPNLEILKMTLSSPQVSGMVMTPAHTLASDCYISIKKLSNNWMKSVRVSDNGAYTLGNLEDGFYVVKACPGSGDIDLSYGPSREFLIDIYRGISNYPNLNLTLEQAQVVGEVQKPTGEMLMKFQVEIRDPNNRFVANVSHRTNGKFVINYLGDGEYDLVARATEDLTCAVSSKKRIVIKDGMATEKTVTLTMRVPQISGVMLKPDGSVAQYGWVNYALKNSSVNNGVSANQAGAFNIGGLADGEYELTAYPNRDFETDCTTSMIQTFKIEKGLWISGNTEKMTVTLQKPFISGSITTPTGGVVANGQVEIRDEAGNYIGTANANKNGYYLYPQLPNGNYQFIGVPNNQGISNYAKSAPVVVVVENQIPKVVDLRLSNGQLMGRISAPDSTVITDGYIDVRRIDDRFVQTISTDCSGGFYVGNLEPSVYKVVAYPGWKNAEGLSKSEEIVLYVEGENGTLRGAFPKLRAAQGMGRVVLPSGAQADNGWVNLYNAVDQCSMGGFSVNEDGKFYLSGLEPGQYLLEAIPDRNHSSYGKSSIIELTVKADKTIETELLLAYSAPQIKGTVKDPAGLLVKNSFVEVRDENGNWINSVPINNSGEFVIGNLENGKTVTLTAYPSRGSTYAKSFTTSVVISNQIQQVSLPLTSPQIIGKVYPYDVMAGYRYVKIVKLENGTRKWISSSGVSATGIFEVAALQPGTYELTAYPGQFGLSRASVVKTIVINEDGKPDQNEVTLTLSNPQVFGYVAVTTGSSVSVEGYIELYDRDKSSSCNFINSALLKYGLFFFDGLNPGNYSVKAFVKPTPSALYGDSQKMEFSIGSDYKVTSGSPIELRLQEKYVKGSLQLSKGLDTNRAWVEIGTKPDPNKEDCQWLMTVLVGSDGTFIIPGLENGQTYYVQAFYQDSSGKLKSNLAGITMENDQPTQASDSLQNLQLN